MAGKQGKVFSGEDDESDEEEEYDEPLWINPSVPKSDGIIPSISIENEMISHDEIKVDEEIIHISLPTSSIDPINPWNTSLQGEWTEIDGKEKMSCATASHLQSVLDGTMHQILELAESQEHLLSLVMDRNVHLLRNPELSTIEQTMSQIPAYFQKVIQLKLKMNDITINLERLKGKADYLQVEAQSRAIAKEEKKEKQSQWNRIKQPANVTGDI